MKVSMVSPFFPKGSVCPIKDGTNSLTQKKVFELPMNKFFQYNGHFWG